MVYRTKSIMIMSMKRYTKWIVAALGAGLLLAAVPAWADSKKKGNDKEAYALMRGNEAFNNGEVLDARDWYQRQQKISSLFNRCGTDMVSVSTDEDFVRALLALFQNRSRNH